MSSDAKIVAVQAGSKLWDFCAAIGIYLIAEKMDVLFWISSFFGKGQ